MKGAITLPCANTRRTLISSMTRTIGNSQNFFRVFMKSHNSANMDIIPPSELLRHGFGLRTRGIPNDPIGVCFRSWFQTKPVLASQPRDESSRCKKQEKQNSGHERVYDSTQQQPQCGPSSV